MSFGFGVGDFLAVGGLLADITASLRETGGAKSEYQELTRELEVLHKVLQHLDTLQPTPTSQADLESIKYAALSCRRPLEDFLCKIRRYEKSLGVRPENNSALKATAEKLRWSFGKKDDIRKLQNYLSIHMSTINMMLAEYGLEKIDIASAKTEMGNLHIKERLDNTRDVIQVVKNDVGAQTRVLETTQSILSYLFQMVSGEIKPALTSLAEMVVKICVSTQQIYDLVLEIKGYLATVDTRWTFFQAPLIVEDALGLKFPVPSEYDFDLLDTIIRHRFRFGDGSVHVRAGNYELCKTKNSRDIISPGVRLLPGMKIRMAILILRSTSNENICPMPLCGSVSVSPMLGGGSTCEDCGLWFDQTTKKRRGIRYFLSTIEGSVMKDSLDSRTRTVQEYMANVKNVKCADEEIPYAAMSYTKLTDGMLWAFITAMKKNPEQSYVQLLNSVRDEFRAAKYKS